MAGKKKMEIDLWYKDEYSWDDITSITCSFYPHQSFGYSYRGNIYHNSKPIGDYATNDSCLIEETFGFTGFSFG